MAVAEGQPSRQNPAYRPADELFGHPGAPCRVWSGAPPPLPAMRRAAVTRNFPVSSRLCWGKGGRRMANDLTDKIPQWLKSLHSMENELRNAARSGLVLDRQKASEHLAAARRHLEATLKAAQGGAAADGPQTPSRKEGEF